MMISITAPLPQIVAAIDERAKQRNVDMRDVLRLADCNYSTWKRWKAGSNHPRLRDLQAVIAAVEKAKPRRLKAAA